MSRPFTIVYAPEAQAHAGAMERKYHRLVERTIAEQLGHTPAKATRNRKPIQDPPGPLGSTWELRFGPANRFRAYYEIIGREVWVLAIGAKDRNRVLIAGEEMTE